MIKLVDNGCIPDPITTRINLYQNIINNIELDKKITDYDEPCNQCINHGKCPDCPVREINNYSNNDFGTTIKITNKMAPINVPAVLVRKKDLIEKYNSSGKSKELKVVLKTYIEFLKNND